MVTWIVNGVSDAYSASSGVYGKKLVERSCIMKHQIESIPIVTIDAEIEVIKTIARHSVGSRVDRIKDPRDTG